jgi:hypothetical protein
VKLHPVVVAQPPHKAARRCGEAALVVPDEANDVNIRRGWAPGPSPAGRSTPEAPPPRLALADRHSRARVRRTLSPSTESTAGGPAPRLAESGPSQVSAEAKEEEAREGETSRGREQGGALPGSRGKGPQMLSDGVKDFSLPLSQFIALGGRAPETTCAVRINCRCRRPLPTAGPHHAETVGYARTRDHYSTVTEGPRHPVTSVPHVVHYASDCAAWKGTPAAHDRCHDHDHLMARFLTK